MKTMMGKEIPIVVLLIGLLLVLGCSRGNKESNDSEVFGLTEVKVAPVKMGEIKTTLSFLGDIKAWRELSVVPDIPGRVARIYVKEGDVVEEGRLMAELDTRGVRLQLEQARAGLAVAQANFNDAKRNWERMKELHEKGTISPQEYEKVQLGLAAAEAQLQQARSGLNLAKYQLDMSIMRAPFSGIITDKLINEGEVINPQMSVGPKSGVVMLMDISRLKIFIDVPEREIGKITLEDPALVRVKSYPDEVFDGKVSVINPAADPLSRSFSVQIEVPNPQGKLKVGTFAKVAIITERHENTLIVPPKAVLKGNVLFIMKEDSTAQRREVQVGLEGEGGIEILDGVKADELVIIEGNYGLEDGVRVIPKQKME
ncbi:efflux RND transporter periplasmic adaptor subunit [candidate division KSB1 bacterium]|nr:efflux RND transporter periplasmic adaptor subunit [candidate division KSB1 bacterium]